ncbi:MAG: hypothetical protein R6U91_10040 [Bacillota bacterium]
MITEISKKAGVGKYKVVSAAIAIRLLYDYVFENDQRSGQATTPVQKGGTNQ